MSHLDCLTSAVDTALTWDTPQEMLAETVRSHACYLAGINPDDLGWPYSDL